MAHTSSHEPTQLQQAIVHGDELLSQSRALAGQHGHDVDDVVQAIVALLQFIRSEDGPQAHYAVAQRAAIEVDAQAELHALQLASGLSEL